MESTLAIGRIVHYKLSESDAEQIRTRRAAQNLPVTTSPGNYAAADDVYPAVVVRSFEGDHANLQVLLDGPDTFWATSRGEGTEPGSWAWPKTSTPDTDDAAPDPEAQTPVTPAPAEQPTQV